MIARFFMMLRHAPMVPVLLMISGCSYFGGESSDNLYRPSALMSQTTVAPASGAPAAARSEEVGRLQLQIMSLETALAGLKERLAAEETRASAEGGVLARAVEDGRSEHDMLAGDVDRIDADLYRLFEQVDEIGTVARKAAQDAAALRLLLNVTELGAMGDEAVGIAPEPGQRFAVHLASYRDEAAARAGWAALLGRFRDRLASLEPRLDPLDLGNGDKGWLRLIAGPFGDVRPAREACEAIRAADSYCQVTIFRGAPLR